MFTQRCAHNTRSLKAIKHPSAHHHKRRECEQTNLESVINSYPAIQDITHWKSVCAYSHTHVQARLVYDIKISTVSGQPDKHFPISRPYEPFIKCFLVTAEEGQSPSPWPSGANQISPTVRESHPGPTIIINLYRYLFGTVVNEQC